jgi:hypothetical protein
MAQILGLGFEYCNTYLKICPDLVVYLLHGSGVFGLFTEHVFVTKNTIVDGVVNALTK